MNQNTLTRIIKENFSSLSAGQKKVAEFYMKHMDDMLLLTAFQVGRKVGVSETTVIRLAYALGFSGYSQMQEVVRREWLSNKQPVVGVSNPSQQEDVEEEQLFNKVVDKERLILEQLLQQLNAKETWDAVDEIIQADRVYIGGFGSSYAAAYWFYFTLKQQRENVLISSPTGFLPEDLCDLTEKSVAVIFSYPRYRKETIKLVNLAKKQKTRIVVITNRQLSPVGQLADITLTTEELMESGDHSIASVVSLLEVIIAGIQHRDHKRISKRQQKLEHLYTGQELFLE
ncbi:MurR/RpiR family transcriptional regulator [Bacillus sp. FJAT-29790]|uniref:MurR/RpiR family transcriptional regulator n=1 Tax=Bacillus sp. FJAT-29790 TaxID=1895002 RepID=UPI001C24634C|nr:MurR/RpiR family transcriptional regulator [Bacillus sp. FJAT-29790]MBU8877536.1 MurR/RpiR family transcriptional regulator [Bacillus sp. FJAT-29790]